MKNKQIKPTNYLKKCNFICAGIAILGISHITYADVLKCNPIFLPKYDHQGICNGFSQNECTAYYIEYDKDYYNCEWKKPNCTSSYPRQCLVTSTPTDEDENDKMNP